MGRKYGRKNVPFWNRAVVTEAGCWEWQRARVSKGYGSYRVGDRSTTAHRHAFELTFGPIPKGMQVCHKCDNPPCINPAHLFLGTNQENQLDSMAKGRRDHLMGSSLPTATCSRCGKETRWQASTRPRKFCSRECQRATIRKIDPSLRQSIREAILSGDTTQAETARRLGVSDMTIWSLVHGK